MDGPVLSAPVKVKKGRPGERGRPFLCNIFYFYPHLTETDTYQEPVLLRQVAEGDEAAFASLYHHWQPFLATHIYRITGSRELAEEVVQDVFMKIWMTREALSQVENFRAYLLVMSRNHALNALKGLMRRFEKQGLFEKDMQRLPPDEEGDLQRFRLSLMDEAIDRLPPRQKEIYLLHRHQRLTYVEIADQLNIGRETVKTQLQLSVKSITAFIKGHLALLIALLEMNGKDFY
jgi:RNA polymerase sigma-70 factor (ECF subfamily)